MRWERRRRRSASLSRGTRRPWMWVAKLAPNFGTTCSKNSPRANSCPRISQDPRTLASLSGLFANPFPSRTISEKVLAYLIRRIFYFLLSNGYSDILIRVFKEKCLETRVSNDRWCAYSFVYSNVPLDRSDNCRSSSNAYKVEEIFTKLPSLQVFQRRGKLIGEEPRRAFSKDLPLSCRISPILRINLERES